MKFGNPGWGRANHQLASEFDLAVSLGVPGVHGFPFALDKTTRGSNPQTTHPIWGNLTHHPRARNG